MNVYLGYQCYQYYCEENVFSILRTLEKVFDDEVKARVWKEDFESTGTGWREYDEMEVE